MGRKAGTEVGVNSCLVALIATGIDTLVWGQLYGESHWLCLSAYCAVPFPSVIWHTHIGCDECDMFKKISPSIGSSVMAMMPMDLIN